MIFEKIYKWTTRFEPCCLFIENSEPNGVMSFLRKFRNIILGLNIAVFSGKIEN